MKPTETSAASTAFCAAKIEGPSGHLWIDGNGKITAGNGTLDAPQPNAFSLVEIEDCPGSTPSCRAACYVHGLKANAPDTHALYKHNSQMIRRILMDAGPAREHWADQLAIYIAKNCSGGFRWHVSGDVFSLDYAEWIALVCLWTPAVNHWIYTRSFGPITEPLLDVPNLAINISADEDNHEAARKYADEHGLRLCLMTRSGDLPAELYTGDVIFPDYQMRGGTPEGQAWFANLPPHYKSYVCPVDYRGKSENRRCGPCARCLFPKEVVA